MKFCDNLRNLRIQSGLTQTELAERLGTSQSSITAWESERREPDFKTIKRLAEFFNIPIGALLPSDDVDDEYVGTVAESLHQNPKLKLLFDRSKFLSDSDLDAVLAVVSAIKKERGDDA